MYYHHKALVEIAVTVIIMLIVLFDLQLNVMLVKKKKKAII